MRIQSLSVAAALLVGLITGANAATQDFRINGELITKAQQEQLIKSYTDHGQLRTPQLEKLAKHLLKRDTLLMQEARRLDLEKRADVKNQIEAARRKILMAAVVADWIKRHPISEEEIRKQFQVEQERWGDTEVQVRHILVKDEDIAKTLLKKVRSGEDFDRLAREYSNDTPQNKANGGIIDWTSPNMFDKDFADSFKKLKPGQIVKHPVQTRLGWHVIKLEGKRPAERWRDYETSAPLVRQLLMQREVQTYVDRLISEAKIEQVAPAKTKVK